MSENNVIDATTELNVRRIALATGLTIGEVRSAAEERRDVPDLDQFSEMVADAYEELLGRGFTPPLARWALRNAVGGRVSENIFEGAMEKAECILLERLTA